MGTARSKSASRGTWQALYGTIRRLRAPGGCPWDRAQTLRSLRLKVVEEAYELLEALSDRDRAHIREELGDVQALVMMLAVIAEEKGILKRSAWLSEVVSKLRRRHPHVFSGKRARTAGEALAHWEAAKVRERSHERSVLQGLRFRYPQLLLAQKMQRRVSRVGFDWPSERGVLLKVREELGELERALAGGRRREVQEEMGDLLFSAVNLARKLDLDAETTLRDANAKFKRRFQALERAVFRDGHKVQDLSLPALDRYWDAVR